MVGTSTDYALASGPSGVDPTWYLRTYHDVAAAGVDPVSHYLEHGWREGRDPRADFSTRGYLSANEDVARAASILSCTICVTARTRAGRSGPRTRRRSTRVGTISTHTPLSTGATGTKRMSNWTRRRSVRSRGGP